MRLLFVLLIILSLTSCNYNTLEDARQVKVGMSTHDLKYVMGEPWTVEVDGDQEEWYFTYNSGGYDTGMIVYVNNNKVINFYSY